MAEERKGGRQYARTMGPDQIRAFELYYGLGSFRSARKVSHAMRGAYNFATIARWSKRWDWDGMVSQRDLEIRDGKRAAFAGTTEDGVALPPPPRTELGQTLEDQALALYRTGNIEETIAGIVVRFSHFFDGMFTVDRLGNRKCTIPIETPADVAVIAHALKDIGEVYQLVVGERLKQGDENSKQAMSELIRTMATQDPKALASLLRGSDAEVVGSAAVTAEFTEVPDGESSA